jgi:hypothetical protein
MRAYRNPMMDQPINDLMESDHVVAVMPDGRVIDTDESFNLLDEHAPEVTIDYDGPFADAQISKEHTAAMVEYLKGQGWEALCGWSRQHLTQRDDPIMYPSEFIGGRFEERIREESGYWVALAVDIHPGEDDPEYNDGNGEPENVGWIVARKIGSEDEIAARTQWITEDLAPWHVDPGYKGYRPWRDEDVAMSSPITFYKGDNKMAARLKAKQKLIEYAHMSHVQADEKARYLAAAVEIEDELTYSVKPAHRIMRVRAGLMPKATVS